MGLLGLVSVLPPLVLSAWMTGAAGPAATDFLEEPQAIAEFERARTLFESEDYRAAAEALRRAHGIEPAPELLYPWAQAERLGGDCRRAIALYQRFLASDPVEAHGAMARENIALCRDRLKRQQAAGQVTEPSSQAVEPREPATAEQAGRADRAPGAPAQSEPESKPPPRSDRPSVGRDVLGGVLVGSGAAALAAGTAVMAVGLQAAASADEAETLPGYYQRIDRAKLQRDVGIGVMALGGALVIAGAIRYGLLARRNRIEAGAWLVPGRSVGLVLRAPF